MEKKEIKNKINKYVNQEDGATFIEIKKLLKQDYGEKIALNGEYALTAPADENLVFWAEMSEELTEIITELIEEKELMYVPTHPLPYMAEGGGLNLPIAKKPVPDNGYSQPHWTPVLLYQYDEAVSKNKQLQ